MSTVSRKIARSFIGMRQLSQLFLTRKTKGFKDLPITKLETLGFIDDKEMVNLGEVADFLGITAPSVTSIINHLYRHGLITKKQSSVDRRSFDVSLTKKGKVYLKEEMERGIEYMVMILDLLNQKDLKDFNRILQKLSTSLAKDI